VAWRDRLMHVEVTHDQVAYSMDRGEPLEFTHWGEELKLEAGQTLTRPLPEPPELEPISQPAGRAPFRRRELTQDPVAAPAPRS
jgi:alpha,alpha-trehalose phosphorylase